ncbi:hypothetical protein DPMN_128688 [Dreissena polymorpha]|uniref:Uncharacterized protein n=1 Tax=Dreissena polymorpha TaxID=45954 RepID=A0A9D4JZW9_DREPO|nr:hypothetical protein DPMN_128688 [Dreissena polymorpha]
MREALNALKQASIGPDVMGHPLNKAGSIYLDMDTSGIGLARCSLKCKNVESA